MSKYNRQKGHDFERQIAKDFREIGYLHAKTKREARGGNWKETDGGEDLVNTGEWKVQCKNKQQYVSVNTIEEIKDLTQKRKEVIGISMEDGAPAYIESTVTYTPIVITKAVRKEPMAIIPWKDLKELLRVDND